MWWSWNPEVLRLFSRLNPAAFRASRNNPVIALREADPAVLEDERFARDVDETYSALQRYLRRPSDVRDAPRTSYFCMEFGLHESLPLYAGGLGILAGDHAKAASDLGLPFTAVGFFLRDGYFRQRFDGSGWQEAEYPALDPAEHPLTLVTGEDGKPVVVTVHLGETPLHLQAWRIKLGRTTMYLLDSDREDNPEAFRWLTRKLYQGDRRARIQQEIILGIGGLRLLRALEVETDVYHMNEGHCAFLTLELLRERLEAGDARPDAEAWVRERCVFTTHTPVIAGHDRFVPGLFTGEMAAFREEIGLSEEDLLAYGRVDPSDEGESFTMTVLGLKLSRAANGVSALNGEVARGQWTDLYPDRAVEDVPIGHITNGVHLPTWAAPYARIFLQKQLGDWLDHRSDAAFWRRIDRVPDEVLWEYRGTLRRLLLRFVREHVQAQSLPQTLNLDPDALTIGFARRFATYKRAPLLFHDVERAARLFAAAGRPIQVLYAGKAHPHDDGGKKFIQQIYEMSRREPFSGRLVFLENYDMEVGRMLVSGCDVWLNNPRRPMEASGTSGQKIAVHGGLNLSILDGWWPEGFSGENGWAIGPASTEALPQEEQDARDADYLYGTLESEVVPAFYERDADDLPAAWIGRMRRAMRTLPPAFSAERMVKDYIEEVYRPLPTESDEILHNAA